MRRRSFLRITGVGMVMITGCIGDGNDGSRGTDTEGVDGAFTAVYISTDWEVVQPQQAANWNADRGEIREGPCDRFVAFERIPERYEVTFEGRCSEGVVVEVLDERGESVTRVQLPPKSVTVTPGS